MKKIIALLLSAVLLLLPLAVLSSCQDPDAGNQEEQEEPSNDPSDEPTDEPTDAPTDAPTDEPTDEPTDAPADTPSDKPSDKPSAPGGLPALPPGGEDSGEDPGFGDETPKEPTADMSGVKFSGGIFDYTGEPVFLAVSGNLPEGVTVTYENNGNTAPGVYTVKAHFTAPEGYKPIKSKAATMVISTPYHSDGVFTYMTESKSGIYRISNAYNGKAMVLAESIQRIAPDAFSENTHVKSLHIPSGVIFIGDYAVGFLKTATGYQKIGDFTVYGAAGSAAEAYCAAHGVTFVTASDPKVYADANALRVDGGSLSEAEVRRNHLAELLLHFDIDVASYGRLSDMQIAQAAEAVKNMSTQTGKDAFLRAMEGCFVMKELVTVTVHFVDGAGNALLTAEAQTRLSGDKIHIVSPSIGGYYTRDLYVDAVAARNLEISIVYKKIPSTVQNAKVKELVKDFVCWGDSITMGACASDMATVNEYRLDLAALNGTGKGIGYVEVLNNLLHAKLFHSINAINCGVGGETSAVIAARADAETYHLYLGKTVTIGSASVAIEIGQTASSGRLGILRQGNSALVNEVYITGQDENGNTVTIRGNITASLSPSAPSGSKLTTCDYQYVDYTFKRTDIGAPVTLQAGARIVTSAARNYDGNFCIIFIGQNGGYSNPQELIKQHKEILEACNATDYLIISTHGKTAADRRALNDALTAEYGDRYINMGTELSSEAAYRLAGFHTDVIEQNRAAIESGTVSSLFLNDTIHPNAIGYAVMGHIVMERLWRNGAFDALYDYYDSLS